jgi:threonine dehydrogenase-like Zn-dependent dehydrogenase
MGHEFSGTVADYGPGTRRRWPSGTPVVSLPMVRQAGGVEMTGLSAKAPGGYAEQVLVQESLTMPVPNGLSPQTAALTEPLAVAWHAVRRSQVGRKETAVVVGCGPIGLAVILMLKARGVRTVVASDFSPGRRALAERCGADAVIDPGAESPWTHFEQSKYITDANDLFDLALGTMDKLRAVPMLPWWRILKAADTVGATPRGPVVFECVGVPGIIDQIVNNAPLASRVVVVGVCMERDALQPAMAINKEIDLRFVFAYQPQEFREALHLVAEGKVDPTPLITGTVGLAGVEAAFDALGDPEKHAKVLVDPRSAATVPG